MTAVCPCKDCPKKGCGPYHDQCEEYKAWAVEIKREKQYLKDIEREASANKWRRSKHW